MKFRQKIWALPLSACLVFGLGVSCSLVIATHSASLLGQLRHTDNRLLEATLQMERMSEHMDNALEAAAMGDPRKLEEAKAHAAAIEERLSGTTPPLKASFAAHREHAFSVVEGMMSGQDVSDRVAKRRSAQTEWNSDRQTVVEAGRLAVETGFSGLERALRLTLIASALTAVVVLLVLGLASWLIVRSVWNDLGGEPDELRRVAEQVATGRLDWAASPGIDGSLHAAMGRMTSRLRETVITIRETSRGINDAASEIAAGNLDLSSRTEGTASNLQQTASSLGQLTGGVAQAAEVAQHASAMANVAAQAAVRGGEVMAGVVSSMGQISTASGKINDIIGVIDAIAFQTNILALNAAVEAARAGDQGRGFAVVAAEVRNLAQRSADAAKQIKVLIGSSVESVAAGSRQVDQAGEVIREVVTSVRQVSNLIGNMAGVANEQRDGIHRVNHAVETIDDMTQKNAALVEESTAAAASLRDQAARLSDAVSVFKIEA